MAADDQFTREVREGRTTAQPGQAHSVHVKVQGLAPNRVWFYRFRTGDAYSPVGRTRTAPAADDDPHALRLLVASCQHYEQGYYAAHADMARQEADLLLFLGDYIYENPRRRGAVRRHDTPAEPKTLEDFRRRYAHYKRDPQLQANHAARPWILMWDDHEVQNDYAGAVSAQRVPLAAFAALRTAAYQAYFEHLPVDPTRAPSGPSMGLHDQYAWGRLVDVWTLDERQFRSPQACDRHVGDGGGHVLLGCEEFDDVERTVLGPAQERWFSQTLAQSRARWQLIGHGTPVSPQSWRTLLGRVVISDGWDGYTQARERLTAELARHSHLNPVLFAGDVHRHMAMNLREHPSDLRSPVVAAEFVTSSITSRGLREPWVAAVQKSNPDILYAQGDQRGYLRVRLDRDMLHCEMRGTPHPVDSPQATFKTLARFSVEAGQRGLRSS